MTSSFQYWPGDGRSRNPAQRFSQVVRYGPRTALGAAMVDSPPRMGRLAAGSCFARRASRAARRFQVSGTTVMGLPAGTAGLKRHLRITMEFAFGLFRLCLTPLVMKVRTGYRRHPPSSCSKSESFANLARHPDLGPRPAR